jgi:hypothetical protein
MPIDSFLLEKPALGTKLQIVFVLTTQEGVAGSQDNKLWEGVEPQSGGIFFSNPYGLSLN